MLTDIWKEAVLAYKEVRVFGWVGTSSIDFRMIKGFVMYHTSEKSNLDDVFLSLNQPFQHNDNYGERLIQDLGSFTQAWNEDKELVEKTGIVNWKSGEIEENESDEGFFIRNINNLAEVLDINGEENVLAVALLPQTVTDHGLFSQWISKVIGEGISKKVRIMLFNTYEAKVFEEIPSKYPDFFIFLYPNLDIPGAMNQILENTKNTKKNPDERDAISFQQALIKMNEAISCNNDNIVLVYKNECVQLAIRNKWYHLEALVLFFLHSYFISKNQPQQALEAIDKAIQKADVAVELKIIEGVGIQYQYRIAKGNFLFMNKKFIEAGEIYKECLQLGREGVHQFVVLGVYQMLGNSIRKSGNQKEAWQFFQEGWQLLDGEESLQNNSIIKFYAKDMMETGGNTDPKVYAYYEQFRNWWGRDWMEKLRNNEYNPVLS